MAIRYDLDMTNHLALDCETAATLHRHTMRWAAVDARLRRERLATAVRLAPPAQASELSALALELGAEFGDAGEDIFEVVLEER